MKINYHVSLKDFNTFGLDAKAACLIEIEDWDDLQALSDSTSDFPKPYYCIGQGSNLLFSRDYEGTLIRMANNSWEVIEEYQDYVLIQAGAGCIWDEFVEQTLAKGYFGLENLSLIPGTVGSSPVQNIGAYGAEAAQFIERVHCFDWETGLFATLEKEYCEFGYRQSIFKQHPSWVVIWIEFALSKMAQTQTYYQALEDYLEKNELDSGNPLVVRSAVVEIRNSKLPDYKKIGNAGSFFKNPVVGAELFESIRAKHPQMPFYVESETTYKIPAAWLIEQCEWKGVRLNGAGVHENQALILVNLGWATGKDVLELADRIVESIKNNFGIQLHPEVIVL
jgi:UDP-N-acetylmuramate dehydrogenase